jgi:hypothetical protein
MSIKKFAMIAATVLMSSTALASERFVLQLNDAEFNGRSAIALKTLLMRQHRINANRYQLEQVSMMAKSRAGRGTAALRVGRYQSNEQRVQGDPRSFNDRSPRSFDRLSFYNEARRDRGQEWQIILVGNIKVRRIVVALDRQGRDRDDREDRDGRDGRHGDDFELDLK